MNRNERAQAEALDAFLNSGQLDGELDAQEAAFAAALIEVDRQMEPNPDYAAALARTLRQERAAGARGTQPERGGWLATLGRLLQPIGRAAWVGLTVMVLLVGWAAMRSLSQGMPAAPATVTPTGTTTRPLDVTFANGLRLLEGGVALRPAATEGLPTIEVQLRWENPTGVERVGMGLFLMDDGEVIAAQRDGVLEAANLEGWYEQSVQPTAPLSAPRYRVALQLFTEAGEPILPESGEPGVVVGELLLGDPPAPPEGPPPPTPTRIEGVTATVTPGAAPTRTPWVLPTDEPLRFTGTGTFPAQATEQGTVWLLPSGGDGRSLLAVAPDGSQSTIGLPWPEGSGWFPARNQIWYYPEQELFVTLAQQGQQRGVASALYGWSRRSEQGFIAPMPNGGTIGLPLRPALSPDGRELALHVFAEGVPPQGTALAVDTETGASRLLGVSTPESEWALVPVAWPAPERLLLQAWLPNSDAPPADLFVGDPREPATYRSLGLPSSHSLSVAPDGARVAYAVWEPEEVLGRFRVTVRELASGTEESWLLPHAPVEVLQGSVRLAWSPTGEGLLAGVLAVDDATGNRTGTLVSLPLGGESVLLWEGEGIIDLLWDAPGMALALPYSGNPLLRWQPGTAAPELRDVQAVASGLVAYLSGTATPEGGATPTMFPGTPLPPETPGRITPTPAPVSLPVEPVATAVGVSWEGFSPDGRYALYRTHTSPEMRENPQLTVGDFHVLDTWDPSRDCSKVGDHRQPRPHWWLSDSELAYVTDRGEVAVWPLCSDERAVWTERFPELPIAVLAASPDRRYHLLRGTTRYLLLDRETVTVQPLSGIAMEGWGHSAAFSPDGAWLALTRHEGNSYLVPVARPDAVQTVETSAYTGLGDPPEPLWLGTEEVLLPNTPAGSLLVRPGEAPRSAEQEWFGVEPAPFGGTAVPRPIYATRDEAGTLHALLQEVGAGGVPPTLLLYHGERGEVETLADGGSGPLYSFHSFDEAGTTLLLNESRPGWINVWLRPLDPPGAPLQLTGGESNMVTPRLSPSGEHVAMRGGAGLALYDTASAAWLAEWPLGEGVTPVAFSPDGRWLVAARGGQDNHALWLLPVP